MKIYEEEIWFEGPVLGSGLKVLIETWLKILSVNLVKEDLSSDLVEDPAQGSGLIISVGIWLEDLVVDSTRLTILTFEDQKIEQTIWRRIQTTARLEKKTFCVESIDNIFTYIMISQFTRV